MAMALTLPAPAKINLFLRILGRREDGYHDLQTVFRLIDLADSLNLETLASGEICMSGDMAGQDNLAYRAAALLQAETGTRAGASIHLEKNIPAGAGLGGGSSDAATVLLGLNALWQLALPRDELAALGRQLGADVPVFVHGRNAWAEGVGEILTPLDLPAARYLVVYPNCAVSTQTVFSHPQLTRSGAPITIARFLEPGPLQNDCEAVVRSLYPEVESAISWLSQYGLARMSGTGSCVFLALDPDQDAAAIVRIMSGAPGDWSWHLANGLDQSPVDAALIRS
jgi:4-diphosphocytidyl-2-C-methyl-D-erythritol kinase